MAEPKLRFTKEDGTVYPPLRNATMGDFYTERNERGDEGLPVLTVSIHSGVSDGELDEDELGKRVKRSADLTSYKKAEAGDLVFNMMRAWQGAVGSVKTTGMVSPAYIVAKPNTDIDPSFANYYVQTKSIINRFNRLSYGALDFRKRLYWDSFITTEVNVPVLEEQGKIAEFLASVDEVITTSEDEITNLETQKKAVIKKVFLQEVRFKQKDGSDFPDWESAVLGEIARLYQPATISSAQLDANGIYPVFGANGYIGRYNKKNHDTDQVCVSCRGAKCGAVNYVHGQVWITGNSMVCNIDGNEDILKKYFYYAMSSMDYSGVITGGAQPQITRDNLQRLNVLIPCPDEQRLIADFLSDFDEAITAAKKELELWKELKKCLLQQMFV